MKPHSVRYSPTMSGKTALETEEHLKDMHETSAGQSASQVETQRTDWNAEAQQKDFPFLNQKSPKMFSSDSKETFPTKETRGNVIESEKLGQSEVLETRNDSKGAVHEHRSVSSVENETFSDSGRESEKPPKRLILRRQEESINRKPESQSWNVESNSSQRDSVYLSAEEPLYESDTVSQDRQKESTKSSGHSGFSSDRDSNDRQSDRTMERNNLVISERDYVDMGYSQVSKAGRKPSRPKASGRFRRMMSSEIRGRRRGVSSEGRRFWRVVQRSKNAEREDPVSNATLSKSFSEERDDVVSHPRENSSVFVDTVNSPNKDNVSASADRKFLEKNDDLETLFERISIQELTAHNSSVDTYPSSTSQEECSGSGEKAELEEEQTSFLTFGSLWSDLNALNDSSKSPTLNISSQSENALGEDFWGQVNNTSLVVQPDIPFSSDKKTATPISKLKRHHQLSRKRSSQSGKLARKSTVVASRTKKRSKVWMAKQSTSSFEQVERKVEISSSSLDTVNQPASNSGDIPNRTSVKANSSHTNDKTSGKGRNGREFIKNSRLRKEWVAKHANSQHTVGNDVKQTLSQEQVSNSKPKPELRSSSVHETDTTNITRSSKVSNRGARKPVRWRKVSSENITLDEATKVTEQKEEETRGNKDKHYIRRRPTRGRQRSVQYVPKQV